MDDLSKIEHVVVLMLENRSFDHVFGGLALDEKSPIADVDPTYVNHDAQGREHRWRALDDAAASSFQPDPHHGVEAVAQQIAGGAMDGFVRAYQATYPDLDDPGAVMGYLQRRHQPVTYSLAEHYTLCRRWFTSVPTGTIPNRLYSLCGAAGPMRDNPAWYRTALFELKHVFEDLAPEQWAVYRGSLPQLLSIGRFREVRANWRRIFRMGAFFEHVRTGTLPSLSWIEPTYDWVTRPIVKYVFGPPNDDHPPSRTERGQKLIHDVYAALTARPELWQRTVLVVYYDEHGGFADHVRPPDLPHDAIGADGFETLGPRVPALVISPFAPAAPSDLPLDHCSLLKFIAQWLGVPPVGRAAHPWTRSLAELLTDTPRTDLPTIAGPPPQPRALDDLGVPAAPRDIDLANGALVDELLAHHRAELEETFPELLEQP